MVVQNTKGSPDVDSTGEDQLEKAAFSANEKGAVGADGSASASAAEAKAGESEGLDEEEQVQEQAAQETGEAAQATDSEAGEAQSAEAQTQDSASSKGDSADAKEEELARAKAEAKDWQDKYLRLHAEWDTYRRRTNEQRAAEKVLATEKLVESLIPVIDDFERTINYAQTNGEQGLLDGVKAVNSKLIDALAKVGVEVLNPVGEAFNALEAQAVATVDNANEFEETVAEVYQKGYRLGKKVLRAAMVTVTTGGEKRPKEAKEAKEEK